MKKINFLQQASAEQREVAEKLLQSISFVENRNTVTKFLTNFEQIVLSQIVAYNYSDFKVEFFGGFDDAERKKAKIISNEYYDVDYDIVCLKAKFNNKFNKVEHRNILGAVHNLGINFNRFGDIIVLENEVYIFVDDEIADYIAMEFTKAGRVNLDFQRVDLTEVKIEKKYEDFEIVSSSFRIDSIVAKITNKSRSKVKEFLEQDFMIQTENNYELGGISIGLAMNSVDYYTAGDKDAEQEISNEEMLKQAKSIANTVLTRLRQNDALKTVPIVFGIFKQAPKDDIGGGVYVLEATSVEGTEITNWTNMNQKIVVLPLIDGNPTEESSAFENFRTEVQNFFPNLSGVTAKVYYQENAPKKMVVNIMTQFYGESEIIALAQHVTDVANKYLPKTTPVEVRISSINGMEAFLLQDTAQGVFTYHVFD